MSFPVRDPTHGRRLGALLGLACGDSLGVTLEFTAPAPQPWSPLVEGPHRSITGGGVFGLIPGQVSDDSQMAACLAHSLTAHGGNYHARDVAERYLSWVGQAFDAGNQTRSALAEFARTGDEATSGLTVWRASGHHAAGNGSLMRCTPIAVLIDDPIARRDAAVADSLITHADPRCVLACARFVAAVARAIEGGGPTAIVAAAEAEGEGAAEVLLRRMPEQESRVAAAMRDLDDDLAWARRADPGLDGEMSLTGPALGFVRVAFRLAFWELLHADSPAAGIVDVVNRGGDADTNGAVVGGLLGARHGVEAIPAEWVQTVLECEPPPPWDGEYHPRVLVEALSSAPREGRPAS